MIRGRREEEKEEEAEGNVLGSDLRWIFDFNF
jgi:hypothetical protein